MSKVSFEFSAGGIIFYKDKILLLHKVDDDTYVIPKGHIEKGERVEEAALRETQEETGYVNLKVKEKLAPIEYWFRQEGQLIHKKVYIFAMELINEKRDESLLEEGEKGNYENVWVSPEEALKLASFENIKKIIKKAAVLPIWNML